MFSVQFNRPTAHVKVTRELQVSPVPASRAIPTDDPEKSPAKDQIPSGSSFVGGWLLLTGLEGELGFMVSCFEAGERGRVKLSLENFAASYFFQLRWNSGLGQK